MENITAANSYFTELKQQQMKRLTDVGFTKEQAEVLLDIMQTKAMSGGFF